MKAASQICDSGVCRQNLVEFERQIKSGEFILPAADYVQGVVRYLPQAASQTPTTGLSIALFFNAKPAKIRSRTDSVTSSSVICLKDSGQQAGI